MTVPVNLRVGRDGRVRPVCQWCGRSTRCSFAPDANGILGFWDLPYGWSVAPYQALFVHPDDSHGSAFTCPECNRKRRAGERLVPKMDRR